MVVAGYDIILTRKMQIFAGRKLPAGIVSNRHPVLLLVMQQTGYYWTQSVVIMISNWESITQTDASLVSPVAER